MNCIDKIKFVEVIECITENKNIPLKEKDLLPIFHVTELGKLDMIIDDKKLRAVNSCEYYNNENIVFLSYGKISYMPASLRKDENIISSNNLPIVFIFDPNVYKNMHFDRLVCFDSGALINDRFDISKKLSFYEISNPKKKDILAAVWLLYEDNSKYLENLIKELNNKNPISFIAKINKLFNEIHRDNINAGLLQATTFELQKENEFDLTALMMIVPEKAISVQTQESIKEYLDNDIEFIIYPEPETTSNGKGMKNSEVLKQLEDTVKEFKEKIYGKN